jgi:glycosyltransferase involved in cell wall biosynthesis
LFRTREDEYGIQKKRVFNLLDHFSHKEMIRIKSVFLSGDEIKAYIAASDLIVLPFKHVISDFPLGVVEAMSMGKPVVSTRLDGLPELLEDGRGIVIDPGDFTNLGKILAYFSENASELSGYGKRAQQYLIGRPTWRDSAEKMLELFSNLLKN